VLIDRRGELWPVRGGGVVTLITQLARSEDPRGFTVVFDQHLWETAGRHDPFHMAAANPDIPARGGPLHEARTLEELADALSVPRTHLARAAEQHAAQPGKRELEGGPFYAAPALPGITFTMGGAAIDATAAVRDRDGDRLSGIFAAGSTVGGVHGGPNGGYVGGLAVAATLGYIAAESAAERVRREG
jgi:fumarate reductase flavoprotein subunit